MLHLGEQRSIVDNADATIQRMAECGYLKLYLDHVMQADTGADLDILTGGSGAEVPRESH